jgi:hypothetical protein
MISALKESLLVFVDSLDKPNSNYDGSKKLNNPVFAIAERIQDSLSVPSRTRSQDTTIRECLGVSMDWTAGNNHI